ASFSSSSLNLNQQHYPAALTRTSSISNGRQFVVIPMTWLSHVNVKILVAIDYLPKSVEAKALPTNGARVAVKFLKSLFARFGTPRAIISDHGTHFGNDQFAKVMLTYGVTNRLSTAYHPQTSGQVEVSNHGLIRILERIVGENRASWSDKLDDALWAFRTEFKTPIRSSTQMPAPRFLELHQIDTFYNALTQSDQDSRNATACGNLLNCTPRDALTIIENKSKVRTLRNKPFVSKVNTTTSSTSPSPDVTALTEIVKELLLNVKATQQATVKAIEETCVTYGGSHPYYECLATGGNIFDAYAAVGPYYRG
nr:reverse transcriptase domain-containing protein [Tanacetum cinerariifolium]